MALEEANPGAMLTIQEYLSESGVSLAELKAGLLAALGLAVEDGETAQTEAVSGGGTGTAAAQRAPSWHPWGSDNVVIADAMDLLDTMADVTGRNPGRRDPVHYADLPA